MNREDRREASFNGNSDAGEEIRQSALAETQRTREELRILGRRLGDLQRHRGDARKVLIAARLCIGIATHVADLPQRLRRDRTQH
jgi:hypothetical protein